MLFRVGLEHILKGLKLYNVRLQSKFRKKS